MYIFIKNANKKKDLYIYPSIPPFWHDPENTEDVSVDK